ncbi:DUF2147 domain-containing protein [Hyphomicrobium nitrativorans]|uniref:DUF2147 domain-containing protein n=1 Tax=Hyphomicrobium nitrativorans TaxID=1427356 RepID=UPI00059E35C5|nr:DUF2147 domain-containing protein [Hyphomicrobium nitrativorans]
MPFERKGLRAAAIAAAVLVTSPALAADAPLGVWVNDTGRGAIEIKQCGDKLCGHVVWVKDTADVEGCGRQIIGDVTSSGGGVWGDGWIYSPERKRNYNVELTPQKDGTLKVKGFAGVSFLSRTMVWTKAPADLVRCGTEQIEAAVPPPQSDGPGPCRSRRPAHRDAATRGRSGRTGQASHSRAGSRTSACRWAGHRRPRRSGPRRCGSQRPCGRVRRRLHAQGRQVQGRHPMGETRLRLRREISARRSSRC